MRYSRLNNPMLKMVPILHCAKGFHPLDTLGEAIPLLPLSTSLCSVEHPFRGSFWLPTCQLDWPGATLQKPVNQVRNQNKFLRSTLSIQRKRKRLLGRLLPQKLVLQRSLSPFRYINPSDCGIRFFGVLSTLWHLSHTTFYDTIAPYLYAIRLANVSPS